MRVLAALVGVACSACLLTACGGGGSEDTSEASGRPARVQGVSGVAGGAGVTGQQTAGADSTREGAEAGAGSEEATTRQRKREEARRRVTDERRRYGSPSKQSAPFAKYSGPSSQGKLHLAEFGAEADPSASREVAEAIGEYLSAARAEEWDRACGYLTSESSGQLDQLAAKEGKSCGEELGKVIAAAGQSPDALPRLTEGISSLRIQTGGLAGEGAGFALFHASDGSDYWMAVKRQGGKWKVLSSAPQAFR